MNIHAVPVLRPYRASDAAKVVSWVRDEQTYECWCAGYVGRWPVTADMLNQCMQQHPASEPLIFELEAQPVAFLSAYYKDEAKTIVRFGFVILDDKQRGRGLGKQVLGQAVHYAFEKMGAKKLNLGVFMQNPAAMRCYEAVGFHALNSTEKKLVQKCGEQWQCVEMEMDREAMRINQ
ncbi:MAG: GNAT family protein [Clostridia bacterium]